MADKESNGERQDFTQPWKFSNVVLVVEGEKLHVHRAVLAMRSPVFKKMFTPEFQEKEKKEIFLPGKKANEVKELLQIIYVYRTEEGNPPDELINEENCHYLLILAQEYQMEAITQRCEDFIVKIMKESFSAKKDPDIIAELVFAQEYKLKKLKQASIELAQSLTLQELKKQKGFDEIDSENLQEIMKGMSNK
ncbi:BTB and MATH domain-containing protein 36-like [Porites lutea]|uniref:BTB and MATH domain-containing protein 36-like n=1 Tax=Porites lutea TaxID=51062 RepID=UPI003CC6A4A6